MAVPTFDPEQAETFEAGIKSELFDRRLQVNIAAFTTKYKGIQLLIQRGVSPTFENAGTARINGFEIESQAVLSDIFRINASAGYIDAHFTSVSDPTGVITIDSDLPRVPKWTAHIGPEARFDIGSGTLSLRADYSYRSRSANDAENTPELYSRAVSVVDASITYAAPDDRWSITAGGRNIFNERFVVNGTNQLPAIGLLTANYNRPGEWYVTTRVKF
jgi:iron complex outermembrane receptor protein